MLAAVSLAQRTNASSPTSRKRAVTASMKEVAEYLGDTAAVTRSSYVDPRVVDLYLDGVTIASDLITGSPHDAAAVAAHPKVEAAVLDLLDDEEAAYERPSARAS